MKKITNTFLQSIKACAKSKKQFIGENGLYLLIHPTGRKVWKLKYHLDGDEGSFTIGPYPQISLAEARDEARQAHGLVARGIKPLAEKKRRSAERRDAEASTLYAVSIAWATANASRWSERYRTQLVRYLERYLSSTELGAAPIAAVTTKQLRELLVSIARRTRLTAGERKAEGAVVVARNLRGWLTQVFDYAIQHDLLSANPMGALGGMPELTRKPVRHAKDLSEGELRQLLAKLDAYGGLRVTHVAIELLALTFVRTRELRMAKWEEFRLDGDEPEWHIPESRMKLRRPHIVPLCAQAVALLEELKQLNGGVDRSWLFPNQRSPNECMSATTINRVLERIGAPPGFSAHGFRATASTTLNGEGFNSDWIELQLAHAERDQVRGSYNHSTHLKSRRIMMEWWGNYLENLKPGKNVIALVGNLTA